MPSRILIINLIETAFPSIALLCSGIPARHGRYSSRSGSSRLLIPVLGQEAATALARHLSANAITVRPLIAGLTPLVAAALDWSRPHTRSVLCTSKLNPYYVVPVAALLSAQFYLFGLFRFRIFCKNLHLSFCRITAAILFLILLCSGVSYPALSMILWPRIAPNSIILALPISHSPRLLASSACRIKGNARGLRSHELSVGALSWGNGFGSRG